MPFFNTPIGAYFAGTGVLGLLNLQHLENQRVVDLSRTDFESLKENAETLIQARSDNNPYFFAEFCGASAAFLANDWLMGSTNPEETVRHAAENAVRQASRIDHPFHFEGQNGPAGSSSLLRDLEQHLARTGIRGRQDPLRLGVLMTPEETRVTLPPQSAMDLPFEPSFDTPIRARAKFHDMRRRVQRAVDEATRQDGGGLFVVNAHPYLALGLGVFLNERLGIPYYGVEKTGKTPEGHPYYQGTAIQEYVQAVIDSGGNKNRLRAALASARGDSGIVVGIENFSEDGDPSHESLSRGLRRFISDHPADLDRFVYVSEEPWDRGAAKDPDDVVGVLQEAAEERSTSLQIVAPDFSYRTHMSHSFLRTLGLI